MVIKGQTKAVESGVRGTARPTFWGACLVLVTLCLGGMRLAAAEVSVFAAASLTDALKEVAGLYEKNGADKIVLNLSASSTLARQIEAGAPADLFFSADDAQMDRLERKGLVVSETRKSLLSNSLVVVVAAKEGAKVTRPEDLAGVGRIALGDPKAVPIGVYARQYLEKQKLWKAIEPRLVLTEDVRAALAAVAAGNADASIVYKTDTAISSQVKIAFEIPREQGPRISYPVALLKDAKQAEAGGRFLRFLASAKATEIFRKHGFLIPEGP
jgi:molybdate transport system substrate-binding protein